jgi:hypothetical protein
VYFSKHLNTAYIYPMHTTDKVTAVNS